jgi:thioredoxin-related protein
MLAVHFPGMSGALAFVQKSDRAKSGMQERRECSFCERMKQTAPARAIRRAVVSNQGCKMEILAYATRPLSQHESVPGQTVDGI